MPLQRGSHGRVNELADITTERGDLAHQCRRNERELFLWRHEHRFYFGCEVTAHVGELEFELEIRDGARGL